MKTFRFWMAFALFGLWLGAVVPLWLLGIGFAGQMVFAPNVALQTFEGVSMLAVMYGPPLLSGVLLFFHFRDERAA